MHYLNRALALYARWIDWLERQLTPRSLREEQKSGRDLK